MKHLPGAIGAGIVVVTLAMVVAAQQPPAGQPAQQQTQPPAAPPAAPAPTFTATPVPGTVLCPAPTPPATLPSRSFTAATGIIMNQVPQAKVQDFDMFLTYVRDAIANTTDPVIQKQAVGWRFFRDTNPGPNGDVVYVFLFDPAVPCVDYGLGPILAAAIPDPAKLSEVWNLYKLSVRTGGSIMNLVPVPVVRPTATGSAPKPTTTAPAPPAPGAPATQKPATPAAPLETSPNRPPATPPK